MFSSRFVPCVMVLVVLTLSVRALACQTSPHPVTLRQPDGTTITLRFHGDKYHHWFEDLNGYTVVRHRGSYQYAAKNQAGRLVPTGLEVGKTNPQIAFMMGKVKTSNVQMMIKFYKLFNKLP